MEVFQENFVFEVHDLNAWQLMRLSL